MGNLTVVAVPLRDDLPVPDQYDLATDLARPLADLVEQGHGLVLTHGADAFHGSPGAPLDSCVAETQGGVGYLLQQALANEFKVRGIRRPVVTVLTRVVVDFGHASFLRPARAIGPRYEETEARERAEAEGWVVAADADGGWRRVVANPPAQEIVELDAIRALLAADAVVIAAGGGGIPVVKDERGLHMGVSAAIDVERTAALLAHGLGAELRVLGAEGGTGV